MLKKIAGFFSRPHTEQEAPEADKLMASKPPKAVALSTRASQIARVANRYGYVPEQEQRNIGLLILTKEDPKHGDVQVNVYYTKMTVGTSLRHPRQGKTQMFRRNVTPQQLEAIFADPRVHGMGGYTERP